MKSKLFIILTALLFNVSAYTEMNFADVKSFDGKIDTTEEGYQKLFNDVQNTQKKIAKKLGVKPQKTTTYFSKMLKDKTLVEVNNPKYFIMYKVKHPYVIPEALCILNELARRYQSYTSENLHLRITDCLRTEEDCRSRDNPNKVINSCHLHGTTFDISYALMRPNEKEAFARCLIELRNAGYIYVKYEKMQSCFHITIRRKR